MIIDILFLVAGAFVTSIAFLFSALNFVFPPEAIAALTWAVSQLAYLQALFPVDTLLDVSFAYLAFLLLFYTFRIILFAFALLPVIGRKGH